MNNSLFPPERWLIFEDEVKQHIAEAVRTDQALMRFRWQQGLVVTSTVDRWLSRLEDLLDHPGLVHVVVRTAPSAVHRQICNAIGPERCHRVLLCQHNGDLDRVLGSLDTPDIRPYLQWLDGDQLGQLAVHSAAWSSKVVSDLDTAFKCWCDAVRDDLGRLPYQRDEEESTLEKFPTCPNEDCELHDSSDQVVHTSEEGQYCCRACHQTFFED